MGIRFYCPNGHRLNVKSFLAGKRGICPHCDSRFEIPHDSQIPEDAPKVRPIADQKLNSEAAVDVPQAHSGPETVIAVPPDVEDGPIAESPDSVWYVRPPAGGQFGPARGDVLRQWIAEGRVSSDSMVWREGWPDWRAAGQVLPGVVQAAAAPELAQPVAAPAVAASELSIAEDSSRTRSRGSSRSRGKSIAAVVFLFLLIIVLVVVLIIVTGRGPTAASKSHPGTPTRLIQYGLAFRVTEL